MRSKSFLTWLGWGYVAIVTLWVILRLVFFDRLWWVALMNYVAIYLFLPLPVLLALCLWQRPRRLLLGLSIPTITFILLYGTLFLPQFNNRLQGGDRQITVMSFNVRLGNLDYLPLARAIRAAKPDIVGLQEFTPELIVPLAQELAADYPYTTLPLAADRAESEGVGILSRFPIRC